MQLYVIYLIVIISYVLFFCQKAFLVFIVTVPATKKVNIIKSRRIAYRMPIRTTISSHLHQTNFKLIIIKKS